MSSLIVSLDCIFRYVSPFMNSFTGDNRLTSPARASSSTIFIYKLSLGDTPCSSHLSCSPRTNRTLTHMAMCHLRGNKETLWADIRMQGNTIGTTAAAGLEGPQRAPTARSGPEGPAPSEARYRTRERGARVQRARSDRSAPKNRTQTKNCA